MIKALINTAKEITIIVAIRYLLLFITYILDKIKGLEQV